MIGSGDKDDLKDIMLKFDMTLLEAVLYSAILDYGDRSVPGEVADQARHHATYITEHLPPEIPNDNPPKRPGS